MDRFRSALALAAALSILLVPTGALAAKMYTTDTQELALRESPSSSGKSILMVPPASGVELVNPNTYTKVRYKKPGGEVREGWIALRLLDPWPPNSSLAKELGAENAAMKSQFGELDKEKTDLLEKEKLLTDKLTKLNAAYEELKGGAANFLTLKSEYDSAMISLASAQQNIQMLVQENESLKLSRDVRWIVATAAVLLTGWFLGWATSRRKKRRGLYYL